MGFQNSKYCRVSAAPDDNVKELKDAGILGFCPNAPKRPSHPAHMGSFPSLRGRVGYCRGMPPFLDNPTA
ncbi:hypothetical protein MRB53_004085 [Persea americana]|uniref:Uncharacterized protein n=1 Tax=Persea americana TaxID=3435 RepID=A0ACC2N2Y2_PERAE|nr:hypothetical protein MRB53_004085 [Persea americana]